MNTGNQADTISSRSDAVYERNRRKKLEETSIKKINVLIASTLAISTILTIALFQYEEYLKTINHQFNLIPSKCQRIKLANIDIISSSISFSITLTFIIFSKRVSFMRKKFRYRNFALPAISSSWNKNDRFNSCLIYGIIGYQVFSLVQNSLSGNTDYDKLLNLNDVTGLSTLLFQMVEVLLIGLRYYPVLVAAKCNSFVIIFMAAIYMWLDLANLVFHIGKCGSVSVDLSDYETEIIKQIFWYFFASKLFKSIPICIFSSFIVINLTYKSIIVLVDHVLRSNSHILSALRPQKPSDSLFCGLCDIADDENITYSQSDLIYVLDLLNKPKKRGSNRLEDVKKQLAYLNVKYDYTNVSLEENSGLVRSLFKKYIYNWDQRFCFTSRFCQIQVVALLALFYFFVHFSYIIIFYWIQIDAYDIRNLDPKIDFNVSQTVCRLSSILCKSATDYMPFIEIRMTGQSVRILSNVSKASINGIFLAPLIISLLICLLQQFLSIRETKEHLLQLYKGECEYVKKLKNLDNSSISESSFHFGGFFVGYLVWGYLIIYTSTVALAILLVAFMLLASFDTLVRIFFIFLPFVSTFLFLYTLTNFFATHVFLKRNSKILALNNFKAFNVFTYFYFYHDCLMGYLSAILRIINTLIAGIVMMPRISYSFLGRHLENLDNGYSTYSGFLHMEAAHTNPILVCFCSLLYYKDLSEHLRRFKVEKQNILNCEDLDCRMVFKLKKFVGFLPPCATVERDYDRLIVNRWHLMLRLAVNRELTVYRGHYLERKRKRSFVLRGLGGVINGQFQGAKTPE